MCHSLSLWRNRDGAVCLQHVNCLLYFDHCTHCVYCMYTHNQYSQDTFGIFFSIIIRLTQHPCIRCVVLDAMS